MPPAYDRKDWFEEKSDDFFNYFDADVDDEDGLNKEEPLCEKLQGFKLEREDTEEFCGKVYGGFRQEQMLVNWDKAVRIW